MVGSRTASSDGVKDDDDYLEPTSGERSRTEKLFLAMA
jgi:hypothetical protein